MVGATIREMAGDIDKLEKQAVRDAVRSAVRRVILRLIAEKRLNQVALSGASELSRGTIGNVISASQSEDAPSPKLDTLADIVYGLRIEPAEFFRRVTNELREMSNDDAEGVDLGQFEVRLGDHLLQGRLHHQPQEP